MSELSPSGSNTSLRSRPATKCLKNGDFGKFNPATRPNRQLTEMHDFTGISDFRIATNASKGRPDASRYVIYVNRCTMLADGMSSTTSITPRLTAADRVRCAFRRQSDILRRYPFAALIVLVACIRVLDLGAGLHQIPHALGYLFSIWLGAFVTDLVTAEPSATAVGFPIHRSAGKEAAVIVGFTALGFCGLLIRFHGFWTGPAGLPPMERAVFLVLMIFFVFPIGLALLYLFGYRYKLRELGVTMQRWYLGPVVLVMIGTIAFAVAPGGVLWRKLLNSWGLWWLLWIGLVDSALSEEFTRMLLQTRLAAAFRNTGTGFVTATFLWACLHMPEFHTAGSPHEPTCRTLPLRTVREEWRFCLRSSSPKRVRCSP